MHALWPTLLMRLGEFSAIFLAVAFVAHVLVQSLPPERLQRALARRPWPSTASALLLGVITPFCSCSTVPLVAGMLAAGVPLVPTTAFLIVSPLVNPATVALIAALTSPWLAAAFVLVSMLMAVVVALLVALLRVAPRVPPGLLQRPLHAHTVSSWSERLGLAGQRALRDLWRLLPALLVVVLLGGWLYGRVDAGVVGSVLDAAGPLAVPLAVVVGVPVYASTAVLLPLGAALLAGGANLGVVSAFLIGATGLSLPEGVLLQRLFGGRFLVALASAFVVAAVALGYLIQAVAPASTFLASATG